MNKLTKEQSQWLIKALRNKAVGDDDMVIYDKIIKTINQCTEEEFPEFKVDLADGMIYINNIYAENRISIDTFGVSSVHLSNQCFLEFAEGVAKIKEWLDDNQPA